ncbi:MAG: hypothetical protein HFI39_05445 [Lachnospiraceae bacterium]|nr:hypothetical protein [Lachnospiraceae bacterium]
MKKKNCRRFPALMIGSMLFVLPVLLFKISLDRLNAMQAPVPSLMREAGTIPTQEGSLVLSNVSEQASQSISRPETDTASQSTSWSETDLVQTESAKDGSPAPSLPAVETAQSESAQSMEEFFSTALFIGDSRSVGLYEYAGLEGADFFAASGLSVFRLWEKEVSVPSVGKLTLEELLKQKVYDTIFLMTGINELGYNHTAIVETYADTVEAIRALQPEAMLCLCANLHVTKSRSDRDEIYNNEQIDWLNGEIAALADGSRVIYIDVNPLFDDDQGALRSDYSGDDTHPYGKYYRQWGRWLYETCAQTVPLRQETDGGD